MMTEGDHNTEPVLPWIDSEIVPMDVYTAASLGCYDLVRNFIQSDEKETNRTNQGGWSPLMYAAYVGHETVVNLLLEEGKVDVDTRTDKNAATALMLAASCGNEGVVYFLLNSGADINAMDNNGCTALFYATLQGHLNVVKMLIDNGADLERRESNQGLTPLLMAASEGHEGIFNLILNSGADVKAKNTNGLDARQLAFNIGNMAIVNLIQMQSFQYHSTLVRSEAGLGGEDFLLHPELGSSPGDGRGDRWAYQQGSPVYGIKHGPKAFALLRNQQTSQQPNQACVPAVVSEPAGSSNINIRPQLFTSQSPQNYSSSPQLIPQSGTNSSASNSYEDHFFLGHSGKTVKDTSLNERLLKMGIHGVVSPPRSSSSFPQTPEYPLLSDFLQDHKLEKYLPMFEEQEVDFETLLTLSDADLKAIGIKLFGPRRKICSAVTFWKQNQLQNKVTISSLQNEISELKIKLQANKLLVQRQELHIKEEEDLRNMVEGCVLEERGKRQRTHEKYENLRAKFKQSLPEIEEVSNILSHLCDKTSDEMTKGVFSQLSRSLDKIITMLKEATSSDGIQGNTK